MKLKKLFTALFSVCFLVSATCAIVACQPPISTDSSSSATQKATVRFDVNTEHSTNSIKDKEVTIGKRVSKPSAYITDDNPTNLQVYGWYTTADCTTQWDFKNDRVEGDMTLYAKWVELYEVDYYVNNEFVKTEFAFKGDLLEEDVSIIEGYKYLGTYTDSAHTQKYDYATPVAGSMDVYLARSEGIYISDHVEEGELSTGSLTDCLAAYIGTYSPDMQEQEGWVEEYTVNTAYETGTVEEKCTYVNFGYTPNYSDGYVELSRSFDISKSQIIRVWFKNLGNATDLCMYFTTMLDAENNIYSETGINYTQDFCYPNHTGNPSARITLSEDQRNMDESAEWIYVDFNLYEIYKNGYSVWATSPYLGALRFQANYKSENEEDFSNVFLIKAIEGLPLEIPVEDSEKIALTMKEAKDLTADQLASVSDAQVENPKGFVFPKDFANAGKIIGSAELINSTDGLLFYSENEILGREKEDPSTGFSVYAPEGKNIDLGAYTTFNITLRNYGYTDKIIVYVYNDQGVPVKTEMELATRMGLSKTYTANLYGKFGMEGNLTRVEILYTSVGVDNLVLVESIEFSEFVPYDTLGVNLNDKFHYGFVSTDDVTVSFDGDRAGTLFEVSKSGASVVTPDKDYKSTTDGYQYATLKCYLPSSSEVTAVTATFKVGGVFTTPYKFELDMENKGKEQSITLPFVMDERGFVEALQLTFEGTGSIIIKEIEYSVGESSLPYYGDYSMIYKGWADWLSLASYEYDPVTECSIFTNQSDGLMSASMYIGVTQANKHISKPHTTYNVLVTETTKVKIIYRNRTDFDKLTVLLRFDNTEDGTGDREIYPSCNNYNVEIDSNMQDYEWSTLTIEVPTMYVDTYLAKINWQFMGAELEIRAIAIETGAEATTEEVNNA